MIISRVTIVGKAGDPKYVQQVTCGSHQLTLHPLSPSVDASAAYVTRLDRLPRQ